jgi:hypothetical protein
MVVTLHRVLWNKGNKGPVASSLSLPVAHSDPCPDDTYPRPHAQTAFCDVTPVCLCHPLAHNSCVYVRVFSC